MSTQARKTTRPPSTDARGGMALMLFTLLVVTVTLMLLPDGAMAAIPKNATGNATAGTQDTLACATSGEGVDPTGCLPSGRWNNLLGTIDARQDPSNNVMKNLTRFIVGMGNFLITSMLGFTQFCWGVALSLSNFAARFDIQDQLSKTMDQGIAGMKDSLLNGNLVTLLAVLGIFTLAATRIFRAGQTKSAAKRLGVTVLCMSLLTITCGAAASEGANATKPAAGSPWWITKTINDTVNKVTVGINFDQQSSKNTNLMASTGHSGVRDCRDYLQAMHDDYDTADAGSSASSIVSVVNRLWEETQLRSWVTMQYGSPSKTNGINQYAADNAKRAYCHVLESKAGTDTNVQGDLTARELGLSGFSSKKASYLFSTQGFIDPYNSKVHKETKKSTDFGDTIYRYRMAVFWDTCSTKGNSDSITAADGWATVIKNMGDEGTGKIFDGTKSLRASQDGSGGNMKVSDIYNGGDVLKAGSAKDTTDVCKAILTGNTYTRDKDHAPNTSDGREQGVTVNDTDAAAVGWRFDFPNVDGAWSEANINSDDPAQNGVKTSLNYMYGNTGANGFNSIASAVAGVINLIVWGFLSFILIISKLSLGTAPLFLVMALVAGMMPVGDNYKKAPIQWCKQVINLSMVCIFVSAIGNFATAICQALLNMTSLTPGTPVYTVLNGSSAGLALLLIRVFFTKILRTGNPFDVKAMMSMAGNTSLADGIGKAGVQAAGGLMRGGLGSMLGGAMLGRLGRRGPGRMFDSSRGHTLGSNESGGILKRAAAEQAARGKGKNAVPEMADPRFGTKRLEDPTDAEKMRRMGGDTVAGSFADMYEQQQNDNALLEKRLTGEDAQERRAKWAKAYDDGKAEHSILHGDRTLGGRRLTKEEWVETQARREETRMRAANALRHGAGYAKTAARSKPLRTYVRRGGGAVVKMSVGAALMANPATALAGMALAAGAVKDVKRFAGQGMRDRRAIKAWDRADELREANNAEYERRQERQRQQHREQERQRRNRRTYNRPSGGTGRPRSPRAGRPAGGAAAGRQAAGARTPRTQAQGAQPRTSRSAGAQAANRRNRRSTGRPANGGRRQGGNGKTGGQRSAQ